jgi:DNA mismatch endonuclease (patch repair protein)
MFENNNSVNIKETLKRPSASSKAALARMKAAKPRDTAPEIAIRSALTQKGLSFQIDEKPIDNLNRKADIIFRPEKVAVFVDGCFWHGCPIHGTKSKANAEFWANKIKQNQERDLDTTKRLETSGWKVIRVWEMKVQMKYHRKYMTLF